MSEFPYLSAKSGKKNTDKIYKTAKIITIEKICNKILRILFAIDQVIYGSIFGENIFDVENFF